MLNLNLIERLFDAKAYDRLLSAVAANGLELPLPLQVRLSQAPAGAVAMALRRTTELAYGRTDLAHRLAGFLLASQGEDGSFEPLEVQPDGKGTMAYDAWLRGLRT